MKAQGLIFCAAVIILGVTAAADPTLEDLVAAYERSCNTYERAAYRVEMKTSYEGPQQPPGVCMQELDCQVWRDGNRSKFILARTSQFRGSKGDITKQQETQEQLFPGRGFIIVQVTRSGTRYRHPVRARLGDLEEREKGLLHQAPLTLLYGRLEHNVQNSNWIPLSEVLRQSKLSARKGEIVGKPVWILEATGQWGSHTLWLDPAASYLPRRIEQRKKGPDWGEHGKSLDSLPQYPAKDLYYPAAKLAEIAMVVDSVQIGRAGMTDLLTGFTIRDKKVFDNGQSVTLTKTVRVSDIKLNPDFVKEDPFTITTPLEDGASVFVHDEPNIAYEWRGGKIVKKVDQGALGKLHGSRFLVNSWGAGLFTAACLAAAAAGLTVGIRFWRRRRS